MEENPYEAPKEHPSQSESDEVPTGEEAEEHASDLPSTAGALIVAALAFFGAIAVMAWTARRR